MPDLEPVDESWTTALCVVAHPDDLEFGAAAAVARWTDQGKTVVYAMVTSGEAGIDGMRPEEARRVREAEQIESARIVGVETVDFLGLAGRGLGVRGGAAPGDLRGGPKAPAGDRDHQQLPGHLGRAEPEPGRPHRHREGHPGRSPRRREPLGVQRAARGRAGALGRCDGRSGRPSSPQSAARRGDHSDIRPWVSSRCGPTRPTSTGWAGRTSTRRSSWKAAPAGRHAARRADGHHVRGVSDGLGRLR